MQNLGYGNVYFTQLDYFTLQTFVIHVLLIRSLTSRLISRSLQGLLSDITRVHQVWSNSLKFMRH